MTDFKATPEQWDDAGAFASDTRACLLELRARVEALEAGTTCPHVVTSDEGTSYCALAEQTANSQPTPNDRQIRSSDVASSLVERVVFAIGSADWERDETPPWTEEARAAIREVATWLDTRGLSSGISAARWLREEVER